MPHPTTHKQCLLVLLFFGFVALSVQAMDPPGPPPPPRPPAGKEYSVTEMSTSRTLPDRFDFTTE